jgi:hypothetical protein
MKTIQLKEPKEEENNLAHYTLFFFQREEKKIGFSPEIPIFSSFNP